MQLDKVVAYHKALADPTRIKMLVLLAGGEMNGQTLAVRLGITPATVTHHAVKLREAGLIGERRDKNTIYFTLNAYMLRSNARQAVELIMRNQGDGGAVMPDEQRERVREAVLRNFFTKEGRLKHMPAQLKKKLIVLEHIVSKLEAGKRYPEAEINAFIKQFHDDFATMRREFIMHQYMAREDGVYELNPRELWAKWEMLA